MPLTEQEEFELLSLERERALSQGQEQGQPDVATAEQYLPTKERLTTGFRVNPEQYLEQQRQQRGLAPGTPLEPTPDSASFMANVLDIPSDLIDAVGPAFPAVGQFIGGAIGAAASTPTGGTAAPMSIAAGGVAGAAGGEIVRQAIGEFLNLEDAGITDRAKKVALEGAFGAVGEGVYLGGNALLNATKKGILKSGAKLLSQKGLEGFVKGFSKIVNNLDPEKFDFAMKAAKSGDNSIFQQSYASKDFSNKFLNDFFFGSDGNIMNQINKLSQFKGSREGIKQVYKDTLGVSDEAFDMASKHGKWLEFKGTSSNVIKSLKEVNSKIPKLFNEIGDELSVARLDLAKQAGSVDVSDMLSAVNKQLGDSLSQKGLLTVSGDGIYQINPSFSVTSTGRTQAKSFADIVTKFFKPTKPFSSQQENLLKKAIVEGDEETIKNITRGKYFTSNVDSTYKDFANKLRAFDVQISGKEFDAVGELSPDLTVYLRGLRDVSNKVAEKVGNVDVPILTKEFSTLADNASMLRNGSKVKDIGELETLMMKFTNPKTPVDALQARELNDFLKKRIDSKVFDNIKAFKAFNELKLKKDNIETSHALQKMVNVMRDAFGEQKSELLTFFEKNIDPFVPSKYKIALNAKRHTVAEALQKDSLSLLKARFLSSGLMIGGAVGGGLTGGTLGLATGMALQNPKVLQKLIRLSARAKNVNMPKNIPFPNIKREQAIGGTQLLKSLLSSGSF